MATVRLGPRNPAIANVCYEIVGIGCAAIVNTVSAGAHRIVSLEP